MFSDWCDLLLPATGETIYMVLVAGLIAIIGGIPLGVILLTTRPGGILHNTFLNKGLGFITNVIRAIPFIILLVALVPLTRFIIGTSIGTNAAIVPLSIGAIPFLARMIESTLYDVGQGLIEAGKAMGASSWQIIIKVLLPEAIPRMINNITIMLISLVGYSAMAGAVGGGGLGSVAINYGYQRFDAIIMLATIIILIILVYGIQYLGDFVAKKTSH